MLLFIATLLLVQMSAPWWLYAVAVLVWLASLFADELLPGND